MTAANGNGYIDLDKAAAAARAEAEGGRPIRFRWKKQPYEMPPIKMWPIEAQADLAQGRFDRALTTLVGLKNWQRLAATGILQCELEALFEQIGQAEGFGGLPNSAEPQPPALTRT